MAVHQLRSIAMRTRLTEILDVDYPVMLAGMGGVSYAELVAAVSNAGGFGCLGASAMNDAEFDAQLEATRRLTDKPFGVDLLTAMPQGIEAKINKIADAGATVYVAGLGVPRDVVDLCHARNMLVVNMCGKVRHALAAVQAGCDLVVAQGTEAGGHTGQVGTMALVPQIVDAVGKDVPVVAAGGIFDGRGLAAALTLGADGIWVGTRFIATPEARTVIGFKDKLLGLTDDGTVVSRAYTGKTCRVIRSEWTQHFDDNPTELEPFPAQLITSYQQGASHLGGDLDTPGVDPDREFYPAGQAGGAINELVPAGELVQRFVDEAQATLSRLKS